MAQLPDVLGWAQVGEPVPSEVGQVRAAWPTVVHQGGRGLRQQYLAGPGGARERGTPVQALLAGVDGDQGRPGVRGQLALEGQGAGHGVRGASEPGRGGTSRQLVRRADAGVCLRRLREGLAEQALRDVLAEQAALQWRGRRTARQGHQHADRASRHRELTARPHASIIPLARTAGQVCGHVVAACRP